MHTNLPSEQETQILGEENYAMKLFTQLVGERRAAIAQSITLVESTHRQKQELARELLASILAYLKEKAAKNGGIPSSFRIGQYVNP